MRKCIENPQEEKAEPPIHTLCKAVWPIRTSGLGRGSRMSSSRPVELGLVPVREITNNKNITFLQHATVYTVSSHLPPCVRGSYELFEA